MKALLNTHESMLLEAKALAVRQRSTLTRLIEEGLRMRLRSEQQQASPTKLPKPSMPVFYGMSGLAQGLSGVTAREMLDLLDKPAKPTKNTA